MSRSINNEDYNQIVKRLKLARLNSGLTQVEVSRKLGRPQSFVSKIELKERRLDVAELKSFAKLYKKPISFFFSYE